MHLEHFCNFVAIGLRFNDTIKSSVLSVKDCLSAWRFSLHQDVIKQTVVRKQEDSLLQLTPSDL